MSFESVQKSRSEWQVANCSIHELQQLQMLSRGRCGVVYVARSAITVNASQQVAHGSSWHVQGVKTMKTVTKCNQQPVTACTVSYYYYYYSH